ncbi:MAG: ATP-binding cassette domain-containing protein [Mogibacterium sp.]|nr:ATP-binding cassette domain-containing protein [Mogibacterium sp.]MBQ6501021.1 ATP-binding cassette domain-containing protein [Mogibacterium sp.]
MSETIIKVDHVRKTYRNYKSNFQKLRHMLILSGAGEKNRVLKDVSFEIKKGEKVAIFGYAHGGKSTLMHIIAGIIRPEAGTVEVKGKPEVMFDYRLGVEPSLSALDNYEVHAKLLGWSRAQIKERQKEIFQAAGLSKMKDIPLKNCPKGSATRLGFVIETMDMKDFFLVDERMTFGNNKINERYLERFAKLVTPEMTLVMAANDFKYTRQFCDRGIVLHDGVIVFDGPYEEAYQYHKGHPQHKSSKTAVEVVEEAAEDYDDDEVI